MPSRTPNILKPDVRPHNGIDGDILYEDEEYRNADDDSVDEDEDEVGDNQNKFRPRPSLPDSDVFKRSLGDLMVLMDGPYLDLNPDYQRDVVWTSQRMTGLINSLIENYYIPPVIFNKKREVAEDGRPRWKRVCVDGKQRLSSVKAFMMGKIPCHDKAGNPWYYCERRDEDGNLAKHRGRRILPLNVKREFREKEFVCYEFVDLTPIQEEDLFARVQMGMSLTPAEKLRATNGPWQDFARLFEEDFREVVNLSDTGRSAGFRHLLTCFSMILEVQHPSKANGKPILKQTPNDLGKLAKNEAALDDATKSHLARVFTTFKELIEDDLQTFKDNGYRNVKTFAPVEMVAVAVLISMYGDTRNHQLLLGDIRDLRTTLRQNLQDLRLNSITWNVVWEYLERLEQFRGAVDGSTIHKQKGRPRKKSSSAMVQPASPKNQRSLPPRIRSAKKQAEEQTDVPQVPPDMRSSNLHDIVPPVKHEEDDYETPLRAAPSLSAVETPARALAVHSNQPSIRSQSTQNRTPTGTATHPPVPTPTAAPAPALPTMQMLHDRFHSLTDPQRFNPINTAQPNINANLPDTNSTPNTRPTTTAHLPNPAYPVPPRTRDHITESPLFMRSSSPPDSVLDLSDDGAAGAAPPPPQHQHQHRRSYQAVAPTAPAAPMVSAGMRGRFNTNLPSRTVGGAGDAVTGLKRRAEIDFGYSGGGRGTVLKKRG